mgnify:CR=1 FL=1
MPNASTQTVVAVFTAARSDLGPLGPVIEALDAVPGVELVVVATGAHLLESRGNTITGIDVAAEQLEQIAVELPDTDPRTIVSALGPIANGVADALVRRGAVSYTHLRAHETVLDLVCRLLLEKKKKIKKRKKKKNRQTKKNKKNRPLNLQNHTISSVLSTAK